MKKMKKLLSVLLAVIMALSCMTVMASAAATKYQTVQDLNDLKAYSPYGQVTRLDTETRISMLFDFLDVTLAPLNIKTTVNLYVTKLNIDFTSVNGICSTIDGLRGILEAFLIGGIVKSLLGDLGKITLKSWDTGMTREKNTQAMIMKELAELLSSNTTLINTFLTKQGGPSLGLVGNFVKLDLSIISDIPGLIKGLVFGLFERWDNTSKEINDLETNAAGNGGVEETLNWFVNELFTNDMSIVTVKADASGNITSETTLPTSSSADKRCYYVKSTEGTDTVLTTYTYATTKMAEELSKAGKPTNKGDYVITAKYLLKEEIYGETATGDHVFAQVEIDKDYNIVKENGEPKFTGSNLKYYKNNSPFLPSLKAAIEAGTVSIDLATNSAAELLYKFIPYVFDEMAPVVLNGSIKKILASWFGARFDYVGEVGDPEVQALPDSSDVFFTQPQGEYLWEWSDYKVINGNHYYRFEDQIFAADLSNTNPYFKIINWDYNIAKGFMNDFIPASAASESTTILKNLNAFVIKVANEVLVSSATFMDGDAEKTFTRPTLATNGNASLIDNIKVLAREILKVSPASIFGSNYADGYYKLIAEGSNDDILTGVACMIVDLVMPQTTLPAADKLSGVKVGAILAGVVRELATQLLPGNNYDALIYSDYTTKAFLKGATYTNSYWLDVLLTMGTDIGVYYLKNLADMGEDTAAWAGMTAAGYAENKTYTAADLNEIKGVKPWEAKVDYIVDWALQSNQLWAWKFEKLVNTEGLTIDMAAVQDPWVKLDKILFDLLPIEEILNVGTPASGETRLEYVLRDRFILALVDLDWQQIVGGPDATGLLQIPTASVLRQANVYTQLTTVLKNLLNGIFAKVSGNASLIPAAVTTVNGIFNQTNIAGFVVNLVGALLTAYNNGLLDTVLPIVGFFLGWHTNTQTLADPIMSFSMNNGYVLASNGSATTTLSLTNKSAGMLYKYRNGNTDKAHDIQIVSISTDTDGIELSLNKTVSESSPLTVAPYANGDVVLTINGITKDMMCDIIVKYKVVGKTGAGIGGTLTVKDRFFISSTAKVDMPTYGEDVVKNGNMFNPGDLKRTEMPQGVILENLADVTTFGTPYSSGCKKGFWIKQIDTNVDGVTNDAPFGYIDFNTVVHGTSVDNTKKAQLKGWIGGEDEQAPYNDQSYTLFPYVLADASYKPVSGQTFRLGEIKVYWYNTNNKNLAGKTVGPFTVYYRDIENIRQLYNNSLGMFKDNYDLTSTAAQTAWSNFATALADAAFIVIGPANHDTFTTVYAETNVTAKYTALENAVKALDAYKVANSSAGASDAASIRDEFKTALDTNEGVKGINFQDYDLYEYFKYHDTRQIVYNRMDEYKAPAAPTNTLWTVSGSTVTGEDYTNAVTQISAKGEKYALAIEAAAYKPSQDDIDNYNIAIAQWKAPEYSELDNDNIIQLLGHYKSVLMAKSKVNKQFLDKEITAAAANYGTTDTSDKYSTKTWAAYYDAYTNAVAVNANANALQSEVFQAKWDLMVAEKNLIEAAKSVLDNADYLKDLKTAVATADAIFADPTTYPVKAGVAAAANFNGTDEEYAYSQLLKARGVTYTNTEGDSVVLFGDSAEEYLTWDRENTTSNLNRIATATNNLNAAIALFEAPANDPVLVPENSQGTATDGVVNVEKGFVYGITVGGNVADFFTVKDGTMEIEASAAGAKNGTGAQIVVKNNSGVEVARYTLIVYGDVDGDGALSSADAGKIKQYVGGDHAKISTTAGVFAADVDNDTALSSADAGKIKQFAGGDHAKVPQTR